MLKKYKWRVLAGTAIFVIAAILRLFSLNRLPVFADESIYVRWSQVMKAESTLRFLPLSDGKQPLFMWLTIPALKVISDPLIAGRMVSVGADLVSVLLVGTLAYLMFKNIRISLITSALYALVPYTVFFARMAMADALLNMFLLGATVLGIWALQQKRLDVMMFAGFALGLAWLTKTPAMYGFALLGLAWVLFSRNLKTGLCLLVAFTMAFCMYNILRLGPEFHMIAIRNQDYIHPLAQVLTHPLDPLIPHLRDAVQFSFYYLTPLGILFLIWGIVAGGKTHLSQRIYLALWVLIPVVSQAFIGKTFTARYLLFVIPYAIVLMAHGLEHLGYHSRKHLLAWAGGILIIISSLVWHYWYFTDFSMLPMPVGERSGYLEEWTAGWGVKEVSQQIIKASQSRQVLVGSEGFFGTPFSALEMYLNKIPNVRIVGVGGNIDQVPDKLVTALSDNQVFLAVNSNRFKIKDPEQVGLKLLASYPKALKSDGTRDFLLFFEILNK